MLVIRRFRTNQAQDVAELDGTVPVVLGQAVLVELLERPSQAVAHLRRHHLAAFAPQDGEEFSHLVRTLNDSLDGLGDQWIAGAGLRQHLKQEQRDVTQVVHLLASIAIAARISGFTSAAVSTIRSEIALPSS
ncbi:hypothetical protein [Bradyrhizobium elkanii]|uniref:hypothetical protein n=1 Tax=Bradyrhizobium elkanii TaxID=29448 RepID=UPI002FEFA201